MNKSWRQHSTKQQLYGHLPPITKTIIVRRTRHAGSCWRSRDELISDVLWTSAHGRAKAGRSARTYIQQLGENTEYSPEDLTEAMNNREEWRERVRDICAGGMTWWWQIHKTLCQLVWVHAWSRFYMGIAEVPSLRFFATIPVKKNKFLRTSTERLFGLLLTESLTASSLTGYLAVNFFAFLLRLFTDPLA